jgi:hypothetical protein
MGRRGHKRPNNLITLRRLRKALRLFYFSSLSLGVNLIISPVPGRPQLDILMQYCVDPLLSLGDIMPKII